MRIRVALADDQTLVREALKALLDRLGFEVVIEANEGQDLLSQLAAHSVDVILSDIRMPGMDGFGLLRSLRESGSSIPVVMLTTFEESDLFFTAIQHGAQGFLLKGAPSEDLHKAIEAVHRGETWLAPVSTADIRDRLATREKAAPLQALSERELAVLRLLAGGYSNKEIARIIHLAEGTVKNHVSEILTKLGARDRTRAVLKAVTLRIV